MSGALAIRRYALGMRCLILFAVALTSAAGCSLTVEPRYTRTLPALTDGAVAPPGDGAADSATVDAGADAVVTLEAGAEDGGADGGSADGGGGEPGQPACVPTTELCNDRDDNCNGLVDDVATPVPAPACITVDGRAGTRTGCVCTAIRQRELCFNGLDDDGNGAVDEGCECAVYVAPPAVSISGSAIGGRPVVGTVEAAVMRLPPPGSAMPRVVCLITPLTAGECDPSASPITGDVSIPPDTVVVGGYRFAAGVATRDPRSNCRTKLINPVRFFANSDERSVLSNVTVEPPGATASAHLVAMLNSGWIVDSTIRVSGVMGRSVFGVHGLGGGAGAFRGIHRVELLLQGDGDVEGLALFNGRVSLRDVTLALTAGSDVVGVRAQTAGFTLLNQVVVAALSAPASVTGVVVSDPTDFTGILNFAARTQANRTQRGIGFELSCERSLRSPVQIVNSQWPGLDAQEATGVLVRGCRLDLASTVGTAVYAAKSGTTAATTADGVRCELGARCDVSAPIDRSATVTLMGRAPTATATIEQTTAIAINEASEAQLRGVNLEPGGASRAVTGLLLAPSGARVSASHLRVQSAVASSDPSASRGVHFAGGTHAELRSSVVRVFSGNAVAVVARPFTGLVLTSNTLLREPDSRFASVELLAVQGAQEVPNFRFVNNLLSCGGSLGNMGPLLQGLVLDTARPFSRFAYNMVAACTVPLVASGVSVMDVQAALDPAVMAGRVVIAPSAGFAPNGWALAPGSAALDVGSLVTVTGVPDIEGERRPQGGPDIGADEE